MENMAPKTILILINFALKLKMRSWKHSVLKSGLIQNENRKYYGSLDAHESPEDEDEDDLELAVYSR